MRDRQINTTIEQNKEKIKQILDSERQGYEEERFKRQMYERAIRRLKTRFDNKPVYSSHIRASS